MIYYTELLKKLQELKDLEASEIFDITKKDKEIKEKQKKWVHLDIRELITPVL